MVEIKGASLVRVDSELLDQARAAFRPRDVVPDMSRDQIMMDAGAKKVLDWMEARIKQKAHKTEVKTEERALLPDTVESALRAAFGGESNG